MPQRYQMLRRIQPVLRILAWVAGGLFALESVFGLIHQLSVVRTYSGVIVPADWHAGPIGVAIALVMFLRNLLISGVWWLALTVGAEFISVVIDTEENTRLAADLLQEPEEAESGASEP